MNYTWNYRVKLKKSTDSNTALETTDVLYKRIIFTLLVAITYLFEMI